jgi:hypothetical protein
VIYPGITVMPRPPVATRPPDYQPIAQGLDQQYPLTGTYEWSPDLDWWHDWLHTSDIKYQARPPCRPI